MLNYAQLDENNMVIGVSSLSGEVDNPNMVKINEYDESLLGKLYENGNFIDMEYYAELDSASKVVNILSYPSNATKTKNSGNEIPIDNQDYSLIGCKYVDGKFIRIDSQIEVIKKEIIAPVMERLKNIENKLNNQ